jgi:hypothetical protein
MDLSGLLRLGHALAGVAFVAGLVGVWVVSGFARRADSPRAMRQLLGVARPFGQLTTAGGIMLAILGLATAFLLGRPILGPLQGGSADWMFFSTLLMLPIFAFLAVVYPRFGRRLSVALAAAEGEDQVTPELTAAWADPAYRLARRYEMVAVVAVLGLMISKPF